MVIELFLILLVHASAVRQMCTELAARYPAATLQDVYKTCYQDEFGAEHMMRDTVAARNYLRYELESCKGQDLSGIPLREPTGFRHRYVRVNLSVVLDGTMTEEELWRMFRGERKKVKNERKKDGWAKEWKQIERIALKVHPQWKDEALQRALRDAADKEAAVHHSDSYRTTYNPHYRIIQQ